MATRLTPWLLLTLLTGCNGKSVSDGQPPTGDSSGDDGYVCKRPDDITSCDPPPSTYSKDKYYCWGCTCAGPTPVAACNGWNGDCRFFATGCYPKTYILCDQNAPDNILGMCGYCFFSEAGPSALCDRLIFPEGSPGPSDASTAAQ